ncbi:MAG: ABC transporter permease subunit [Methanomassiliicoccales archaeon]|nr:MAG: ABC transporter permease subunit [Methanomassiliicoccales archaeon]
MIGQTVWMELRTGWKGILVISILVFIVANGMAQIYPAFKDTLTEDLEGADMVDLIIPEDENGNLTIFWDPLENVDMYFVLESNSSSILTNSSKLIYMGTSTEITTPYNVSETKYYAVMAMVNGSALPTLVGMDSTGEGFNPLQELMDNPGYEGFTGGRNIDFTEFKGFISLELFSWLWILVGMFMAYYSVSSVTSDFEKKRMDLIFSTPISREQYMIEKFLALTVVSLIIVLIGAVGLISGVEAIGESNQLDPATSFLSVFSMLTFLMIIAAFGIFLAVTFRGGKAGMGINIAFVFGSFILLTISGFTEALKGLKYVSIMHYWDYNSMLLDGVFNTGYFIGLLIASLIILVVAVYIFKKRDIPA